MTPASTRPEAGPAGGPASGTATGPLSATLLASLALELDLELTPQQCAALVAYAQLLRRWNRVHNLTAIDSNEDLLTHHLLDCLAVVRPIERALARYATGVLPGRPVHYLDAGSGGGLPGIPMAIARPHWHGLLVDAVQKKCAFLEQVRLELRLDNIAVRHARLESPGLGTHELIVSRAFASLRDFVTLTRPLLRPNGLWVAMKGRNPSAELAELPADVEAVDTSTLRVPQLEEQRHLVILRPAQHGGAPPPRQRPSGRAPR
jgi:16S rRNA (guanine527-N7)-methyltransferase